MKDYDEVAAIVIDQGSGFIKAGFAGAEEPRKIFETLVGWQKYQTRPMTWTLPGTLFGKVPTDCHPQMSHYHNAFLDENYVGDALFMFGQWLNISSPIENGVCTNWENMEAIWRHIFFNEFKYTSPEEHPVFLTESMHNTKANKEKMTQLMFENFNVPALYISQQSLTDLYACGRNSGIVLDIGHGVCQVVPVYEGYNLPHASIQLDLSGKDIDQYLALLLRQRGCPVGSTLQERNLIRSIKEHNGFVALDYDAEMAHAATHEKTISLPDGKTISLSSERFQCGEALFKPSLLGRSCLGIHEALQNAILKVDQDLHKQLWENIVMCGGTSLFPGMKERLQKELSEFATGVKVVGLPERGVAAWLGGSILASLSTFQQMWLSKEDYDESGPPVVRRRF